MEELDAELADLGKTDYPMLLAKAGLNLIPFVGGTLSSLIGDCQTKRNEARLKEFLEAFAEDMNQRIDSIQKEYIENPEFVDIFLNIIDDTMKQRKSDKRILLKNLLVNSITVPDTSYDATEEFERIIVELQPTHFEILKVFYDDKDNYMYDPVIDINRIEMEMEDRKIKLPSSFRSDYLDYVCDLENNGLVDGYINNYRSQNSGVVLAGDKPYVTTKGIELMNYVCLDKA